MFEKRLRSSERAKFVTQSAAQHTLTFFTKTEILCNILRKMTKLMYWISNLNLRHTTWILRISKYILDVKRIPI